MENLRRVARLRDERQQFSSRALWSLMLPLVLEQLLSVTIGMADTVMVSTAGDAAVSSISLVDSISSLLIQLFSALSTGGAVVVSQYLGANDTVQAKRSSKQLLYIAMILSMALVIPLSLFRDQLLRALFRDVDAEVMLGCQQYFMLSLISYPFLALYNVCAALFRAAGNSKTPLRCSLVMNLANIVGNALLIYGLQMGVVGAGQATLASRAAGAIFMLCMLQRHSSPLRLTRILHPELEGSMVLRILRIGVPSGLENSLFQLGKVLLSRLVSTFGTYAIAANAIGWTIASLICVPLNALSTGLLTVVGQCMGAKNPDGAEYYSVRLLRPAYIGGLITCAFVFILIRPITTLFALSEESRLLTCQIMRSYSVMVAIMAPVSFMLPSLLRGAGDVKFPMLVSTLSMWIFRIGMAYLLCGVFHMGLHGVWYAMYLDWACRAILFLYRMLSEKWRRFRVI